MNLYQVSIGAWLQIFHFSAPDLGGLRTTIFYFAVIIFTGLLVALFMFGNHHTDEIKQKLGFWPIGLGLIALVRQAALSGWQDWILLLLFLPIDLLFLLY